ncbi:YlbF/YmcA family competence regulator [Staphylococcus auricularis]|uniref:YlbF family regulator n=1 Tax=Staphylococcus auricularis TaxID=29379 RepID=A0ABX5IHY9_9STAP|nr:YlbF family regulator [Staphylococcus auricularis]MCE5037942.1 RicAFT regulatory complex protein RicA family protein [Staphylococcus auricularis]MEB6569538.1 YlbF family regulator [Staphylococcus auricularis]PTH19841.1 hypothetical protein BU607_00190 [Staphylococcus auricularis]PTH27694.1 hypothetical protein BU608_01450 [Staphylococcus auricularis]
MYNKEDILAEADQLSEKIKALPEISDYRSIEEQIHANQSIDQNMKQLKRSQKQSVNLQNYGKTEALKQSEARIQHLEDEINRIPIVEEFREAQAEANNILQMMISTMADRLNQQDEDSEEDHN